MRDKAFEEAVENISKLYGKQIARCSICNRVPKMDFRWRAERNNRVEVYCDGGRFFKKHKRASAVVVNGREESDSFYTEAVDIWNEMQMKDGYVRALAMTGRKKNDD